MVKLKLFFSAMLFIIGGAVFFIDIILLSAGLYQFLIGGDGKLEVFNILIPLGVVVAGFSMSNRGQLVRWLVGGFSLTYSAFLYFAFVDITIYENSGWERGGYFEFGFTVLLLIMHMANLIVLIAGVTSVIGGLVFYGLFSKLIENSDSLMK